MKTKMVMFFVLLGGIVFVPQVNAELAIGEAAPEFSLTDVEGNSRSLSDFKGQYRVLEWTNHECPFVIKHYGSGNMQELQKTYTDKGIVWLSINSSASGKQGNFTLEKWGEVLRDKQSAATATLLDPDGNVGKLYGAQTTPHMFVIDPQGMLIYQGAIDDVASADPADVAKAKNYVKAALDEAMAGESVSTPSTKSYGCSVKY